MRQNPKNLLYVCIVAAGWSVMAMGQSAHANDVADLDAPSETSTAVSTAADSEAVPPSDAEQPLVDSGVSSGATPPDSPFVEPPVPFGADSCSPNTLPSPLCDPASCTPTRVYVAPYLWVPAVQGTTTVLGVTNDVDVSLGDAFGMLKDLKGAASGHVEIGRGDWTLIMDALLMRFASSADVPLARVDLDASTTFLELAAARRLNGDLFEQLRENGIDVEAIGGVRYYQASVGATLVPNGPILPVIPREQTEEWVDLLVGARVNARLTDTLTCFVRSDFGGFGIGTSSTLTSNLIAGVEHQVNEACLIAAGYRLLDINERQDNAGGVFEFDLRFQGPFAAILFRY